MRIRSAHSSDLQFILNLAPRLVEFGPVPGRAPSAMVERDRAVLTKALDESAADAALFVAEDDSGNPLGFIHLTTADDYYSDRETGHIADIVVAPNVAGQGVGSALIAYAEEWAAARGFAMLTLNVFTANHLARDLYRKLGFEEEWIRCIKRLQKT